MFRFQEILTNMQLVRLIYSHSSPDMMKMYTQYDFVFYLNLQNLNVFDEIEYTEYMNHFLLRLDLF